MDIYYRSTRNADRKVTASQAILEGLAPDGGLYVPETIPAYEADWDALVNMSYAELARQVLSLWLTDFTQEELTDCIARAYDEKFDTPVIAPLHKAGQAWYLELFHGATIAFKDMALSILPHLMTTAARKCGVSDEIVILTATSGDTGKAAMAGFADVPGTRIIVFYPKDGVSTVQEKQMVTQKGGNVHVVGIRGNFDDAQSAVKQIFSDEAMRERMQSAGKRFSSANSINIGRLVPQIVYYYYAYAQLLKEGVLRGGEEMTVTVPTGNFGNILACYYAKQMGLPVHCLVCASNENRVLVDFFRTGAYDRNRDFILTSSPSMDILISSNLERLVFRSCGDDSRLTAQLMNSLRTEGVYQITPQMKAALADFYGEFATEKETAQEIAQVHQESGYVIDTHTAVASCVARKYLAETGDTRPMVIASTASPYKFSRSVLTAICPDRVPEKDDDLADVLSEISGTAIPAAIRELKNAPVLHDCVVDPADMEDEIARWLAL